MEKKQKNEDKPKVEKKLKTDKKLKKEKDNILNDMVQSMNSGGSNKVCQHCGVSFINQAILDTHILIVHGDIQSQIKQEAEDLLSTIKSESIVKNLYKSKNGDIQSQIKQEAEDLLSTIKSNTHPAPILKDFEEMLKKNPNVFHCARTSRCLQQHWQSLKQYTLLPGKAIIIILTLNEYLLLIWI